MPWVIEPVVGNARWHQDRNAIKRRERYPTLVTVTWITPTAVALSGLRGDCMTREMRDELEAELRALGVRQAQYERHGRLVTIYDDEVRP